MSNYVKLALKVSQESQNERLRVSDVEFGKIVAIFREKISNDSNVQAKLGSCKLDELILVYTGLVLDDFNTLESYGITNGSTIFVIRSSRNTSTRNKAQSDMTDDDIHNIFNCSKFRRQFIEVLSKPEVVDKMIDDFREIVDDPVALSLFRDPELIVNVLSSKRAAVIRRERPTLMAPIIETIRQIKDGTLRATTSSDSGYTYFPALHPITDDEGSEADDNSALDDESNQDDDEEAPLSDEFITADRLNSALQLALRSANPNRGYSIMAPLSSSNNQPSTSSSDANSYGASVFRPIRDSAPRTQQQETFDTSDLQIVPTGETPPSSSRSEPATSYASSTIGRAPMLDPYSSALASSSSSGSSPSMSSANSTAQGLSQEIPEERAMAHFRTKFQVQLQAMHDLGFLDDEINLPALISCEGNVEAAVSFVLDYQSD